MTVFTFTATNEEDDVDPGAITLTGTPGKDKILLENLVFRDTNVTFDLHELTIAGGIEEIEFFTGEDSYLATLILDSTMLDEPGELAPDLLIRGDGSIVAGVLNSTYSTNLDVSGWTFEDRKDNWTTPRIHLIGSVADNTIRGTSFADEISGYIGNDILYGNGGNDRINGEGGEDVIYGNNGSDYLFGGASDDIIYGGFAWDRLNGNSGNDTMYGGGGDDWYYVDSIDDVVVETAGAGNDEVNSYVTGFTLSDHVEDLYLRQGSGGGTGNDLNNRIYGYSFSDTIIRGEGGDDLIRVLSFSEDDELYGGAGDDTLESGRGDDHLYGGTGNDTLEGEEGDDNMFGQAGTDLLYGGEGNDTLDGETMYGGLGDDSYRVRGAANTVNESGGEGTDTIISSINIFDLTAHVENLTLLNRAYYGYGNTSDNVITGTTTGNQLVGGRGNDTLYGGGGTDYIYGGDGQDHSYGGAGNDRILSGQGADHLAGGAGDDRLTGGAGNDALFGGAGDDRLTGNSSNDKLYGGDGNDTLDGGGGRDTMQGGAGDDLIHGSADLDWIYGGAGDDQFIYSDTTWSRPGREDRVYDFDNPGSTAGDRFDLRGIDADTTTAGNQTLIYGGSQGAGPLDTSTGHYWFANDGTNTVLRANVDADAAVDFEVFLVDGTGITASAWNQFDVIA